MNGRVYDPSIARFLSPDVQVPFPEHTQSYNRYSYVQNNPLSRIDPTGYGDKEAKKKTNEETEGNKDENKNEVKIKGKIVAVTQVCSNGKCKVKIIIAVSGSEAAKLKSLAKAGKEKSGETLNKAIDEVYEKHEKSNLNDCADYCIAVAKELGISGSGELNPRDVNADALIGWAQKNGTEIKDMEKVKSLAASGEFIIAGMTSKQLKSRNGHVSVVRSGDLGVSGKYGNKKVPPVANRSLDPKKNFPNKTVNWAFTGKIMPTFYHVEQ